jgi:hypothetical protein
MARASKSPAHAFDAITVEGSLIAPAMLAEIAAADAGGQAEPDYGVPRGLTLRDEIPRYFRIGQALFADFARIESPNQAATVAVVEKLLVQVFGFTDVRRTGSRSCDDRLFAVTLEGLGERVPAIIVPPADGLDGPSDALPTGSRRVSAASAAQDWLNATEFTLWGFATNGEKLRLVRDNASLTRPAYIEADLRRIFEDEMLADFGALWLLAHASRFGRPGTPASDCWLERWREAGAKAGVAARDRLRDGVEAALLALGQGFLEHPANGALRERLAGGALPLQDYFSQLLRLVYRLIFLFAAEDRDLLHTPKASAGARRLYAEGYSVAGLRDAAVRRTAWDKHHDRWEGLAIIFAALSRGEPKLGLPALDGLFARGALADLEPARLANRRLMEAIFRLAWLKDEAVLTPVNWRDMETEELGSVYESLLELTPRLTDNGRGFDFAEGAEAVGHARKTTSSYYTPDSLVQKLLDTALNPVLDRVEAEAVDGDVAEALLSVTVMDPACGSGHFLLGAARRIATRVARARAGGVASAEDFRHALRDAARRCIYGVDRNPMAVELAKVALWIETVEPGKPLGFLDANIRCGDALLGVFDLKALDTGIPDDAYKALSGDDKATASGLKRLNRTEREAKLLKRAIRLDALAAEYHRFAELGEDDVAALENRRAAFEKIMRSPDRWALQIACDAYIAAFFLPKPSLPSPQAKPLVPTTRHVWEALDRRPVQGPLFAAIEEAAGEARAFHWPLEFPEIMARGGFDVVLGNPPWDTMSPDVKEFFSSYDPEIRFLSPEDQKQRLAGLLQNMILAGAWQQHQDELYRAANFMRNSGRYTLFAEGNLGKGDFNVYRMFVELAFRAIRKGGVASQIVPENFYNGANAAALRSFAFSHMKVLALVTFENTRRVWFDIDSRQKFCLYAAMPGGSTATVPAVFGINSEAKLAALTTPLPFQIPRTLIRELSPEALAIPEFGHPFDVSIARKLHGRLASFGQPQKAANDRIYMREIDMGNDRDVFGNEADGIPLFEGRMVEAFDYRAKAYVSGRGRQAAWKELPFGSLEKRISPQWRIPREDIPDKAEGRASSYRVGFCDVGGVTNQRFLMAAMIPPDSLCGHSVPTIMFEPEDDRLSLFWLGLANSFCLDFLARQKGALHMTLTLVDSLPLPRRFTGSAVEIAIASHAARLACSGPEMAHLWDRIPPELTIDGGPADDPAYRHRLRAELDVYVARDFFGLSADEMRYLLDPGALLGPDCGIETFGALKRAEMRGNQPFTSFDLIMQAWDNLAVPAITATAHMPDTTIEIGDFSALPTGAWGTPQGGDARAKTLAMIAAILKALPGPVSSTLARRAAVYALEPRLLTPRLDESRRAEWRRLVGAEAEPRRGVTTLGLGGATGWGEAVRLLGATGALVEDAGSGTWAPGTGLDAYFTDSWPRRATFALAATAAILNAETADALTAEEEEGFAALAA